MKNASPPKLLRFPAAKQKRLNQLLEKNREGKATAREKIALERLVAQAEQVMLANAKRLEKFSKSAGKPHGAVPVTIWVQPLRAGR